MHDVNSINSMQIVELQLVFVKLEVFCISKNCCARERLDANVNSVQNILYKIVVCGCDGQMSKFGYISFLECFDTEVLKNL